MPLVDKIIQHDVHIVPPDARRDDRYQEGLGTDIHEKGAENIGRYNARNDQKEPAHERRRGGPRC